MDTMPCEEERSFLVDTILRFYPDTQGIYLFGSYRTENEWPDSDIDLAVLVPHGQSKEIGDMRMSECRNCLEDELQKPIDLINLRSASVVFQFQVINTGRLLYKGDSFAVDEFEMLTLSFYQKLNEERREILEEFDQTGRAYRV